jgi:hypothetical protein
MDAASHFLGVLYAIGADNGVLRQKSFATICSGLCFFLAMLQLLSYQFL